MRRRGLALSRGTVPPIAQRPLHRSTAYRGRNLNRRSGCPDHRWLRSPLAGWVRVFSLPTARGCPHAGAAKFLFAGGSECRLWPVARGFPFAGWLGASSRLRPEVSRCRVAPGPLKPVDLRFPVAGWLRVPPGRWPEVSRCRVAPDLSGPKARRCPLPGGSGLAPSPVARSFLRADGSRSSLTPAGARNFPLPVAPESPLTSGQRPFLCR
jgi:hypothetical protein